MSSPKRKRQIKPKPVQGVVLGIPAAPYASVSAQQIARGGGGGGIIFAGANSLGSSFGLSLLGGGAQGLAAAPAPKSLYARKLEETKRLSGPLRPEHPGPLASKEQILKYQDDLQNFIEQREMDRQCEAIQLATEEDSELNLKSKKFQQDTLRTFGHIARSGCFNRGVLYTQTPFVSLVKWLDSCTNQWGAPDSHCNEFSVCLSRDNLASPWGVLIRAAPDLTSSYCVVGGCKMAVCIDPSGQPHSDLALHRPLFSQPLSTSSPLHAVMGGSSTPAPTHSTVLPQLQIGDFIVGVGALDLAHCAFSYLGPAISDAPAAASTPLDPTEHWKLRSAAFSSTFIALKLPLTRLLLRIRRPGAAASILRDTVSASACAVSTAVSTSDTAIRASADANPDASVIDSSPNLRPNWAFFSSDAEVRKRVIRLLQLGKFT